MSDPTDIPSPMEFAVALGPDLLTTLGLYRTRLTAGDDAIEPQLLPALADRIVTELVLRAQAVDAASLNAPSRPERGK